MPAKTGSQTRINKGFLKGYCGKAEACKRALTQTSCSTISCFIFRGKAEACKRALTHPPYFLLPVAVEVEKQKLAKEH